MFDGIEIEARRNWSAKAYRSELGNLNSHLSTLNTSLCDSDVNPLAPICIGMDYKWIVRKCHQQLVTRSIAKGYAAWVVKDGIIQCKHKLDSRRTAGRRLNIIKSFYVKFERKIPALVEEFCNYYAHHQNKTVVYYYDTTALGANYAVNEQDFHWVVCHEFEKRGWQVEDVYLGNPMRHDEKYLLINQGFTGKQRLMPFFNRQNNDDLILAIQTAGVVRGRNGFRKDKDF